MAGLADEPALGSRFVWLLDAVSRRSEPRQFIPADNLAIIAQSPEIVKISMC
jgi:hypothetical protein